MRGTKIKRIRQAFREKGIPIEANGTMKGGQYVVSKGRKLYQQTKKAV